MPARASQPIPAGAFLASPEPAAVLDGDIPQTSLSERAVGRGDITVQFVKWHAYATTAYQRGCYAGFPRLVAMRLVAMGVAVVALDPMRQRAMPDAHDMVTK